MSEQDKLKLEKLELEVKQLKGVGYHEATQRYFWREEIVVKWVSIAAIIITALFKL